MARTPLTTITRGLAAGLDPASVDVAAELTDGNSVAWSPNLALYVLNGDDASLTVTFPTPGTVGRSGLAIADVSGAVPAAGWRIFGPFGRECVQDDGTVHINYTGTTPTAVMVAPINFAAN